LDTSKTSPFALIYDSLRTMIAWERMMRGRAGFWDLDERYQRQSASDDPLEKLNAIIP
jgi:hypothetical protein